MHVRPVSGLYGEAASRHRDVHRAYVIRPTSGGDGRRHASRRLYGMTRSRRYALRRHDDLSLRLAHRRALAFLARVLRLPDPAESGGRLLAEYRADRRRCRDYFGISRGRHWLFDRARHGIAQSSSRHPPGRTSRVDDVLSRRDRLAPRSG